PVSSRPARFDYWPYPESSTRWSADALLHGRSCHNRRKFRALFTRPAGVSYHGQYARTADSTGSDPVAAADANDRRHERGQGKAQALARAQVQEETGQVARQAY